MNYPSIPPDFFDRLHDDAISQRLANFVLDTSIKSSVPAPAQDYGRIF